MSEPSTAQVVTSWRTLLEAGSVAAMTDAMLLERFATRRDAAAETAFAALVARHGPMVRQVCRRLLVDPHDAEDAFQATFFVLARRAATIRRPERLSSWLYGTAYRTSRKLRAQSARRHRLEAGAARPEPAPGTDPGRIEEIEIVLEELDRLPDACRAAVVLCGLEGWTQDAAARSLGCSDRTLRRRLNQAHGLLRARLTRRGLASATALFASALAPDPAVAAISAATADATARAALTFAAGEVTAGVVPASAALLAEGIIKTMLVDQDQRNRRRRGSAPDDRNGSRRRAGLLASPRVRPRRWDSPGGNESPARGPSTLPGRTVSGPGQALRRRRAGLPEGRHRGPRLRRRPGKIWVRLGPNLNDLAPRFVALAERYPDDPAAMDALLWVVEKTTSGGDQGENAYSKAVGRAMEILVRDHAGDPRLGPLCLKLIAYESPRRDVFLRAIAERSPNRVVKGQATLALAEYLGTKAPHVEMLQNPDAPENLEKMKAMIAAILGPESVTNPPITDAAALLRKEQRVARPARPGLSQAAPGGGSGGHPPRVGTAL